VAPAAEDTAEARPRRRSDRPARAAIAEAPAPPPVRERAAPERKRGVQPVAERDDDDTRIVGFGADLPAFLARPIPVPAVKR